MRIEVVNGAEGWPLVEALDREVYSPEVMAVVPWRDVVWAHADQRVVVWDDDDIRCHAGVFWRDGTFDGAPARMAGIGGVMTASRVRGRGFASEAMRAAAKLMQEQAIDFGLLFCEPHNERLYGNLGWRVFDGDVWCEQPSGRYCFDMMHAMVLPLRVTPDRGTIDLCGLPW